MGIKDLVQVTSHMGDDLMVVNAARVSMNKHHDEFQVANDTGLIKYLAKNNHWTPFSHPQIQLRLKMPIFVANQWKRSTVGNTINEVSRRYVDDTPEFYLPEQLRNRPDGSIKQGSGEPLDDNLNFLLVDKLNQHYFTCYQLYTELLDNGVCPEQARIVLPMSLYTEFYQTGSLYFWARLCKQRCEAHAQVEIQEYAREVANQISVLFPVSWKYLTEV